MRSCRMAARLLSLTLALAVLCGALPSGAANAEEVLYEQQAPATVAEARQIWKTNSSTGAAYTMEMDGGGSIHFIGYYNNRGSDGSGLPEGENMVITIPGLSLNTGRWGEIELSFRYAMCDQGDDISIRMADGLQLYASTDGGQTWSEKYARLKTHEPVGWGNINGAWAVCYDVTTTDLAGLVPVGKTIDALKLRPYGDHAEHYGMTRIAWMSIKGYRDKAPAAPAAPEKIHVGGELLRQIAVDWFYRQCVTEWIPHGELISYNGSTDEGRTQRYKEGWLYRGPAYVRTTRHTLETFQAAIGPDKKFSGSLTDDGAVGLDCMSTVNDGIARVSTKFVHSWTYLWGRNDVSAVLVGGLEEKAVAHNIRKPQDAAYQFTAQELMEAYAAAKPGDMLANGHLRMITAPSYVVRNADGTIDDARSCAFITETGGTVKYYYTAPDGTMVESTDKDPVVWLAAHPGYTYRYGTSMNMDRPVSFGSLYDEAYLPLTVEEFLTGDVEQVQARAVTGVTAENVRGGFWALVASNYRVTGTVARLTDGEGKTVYEKTEYYPVVYETDYVVRVRDAALDAALGALGAGSYRLTLDAISGPVTKLMGRVPVTQVFALDFTV